MRSINYTLLVVMSIFMLTACGGDAKSGAENESSPDMVAPEITMVLTNEQIEVENEITNALESSTGNVYKKADWIPELVLEETSKKVSKVSNTSTLTVKSSKVKSNGDNITGWYVYDADPDGANITSVYDNARGNKVISLNGAGIKNGYTLGWTAQDWDRSTNKLMKWGDTTNNTIKWSMKYSADEDYIIYVRVSTKYGYRYLYYTNLNKNYGEAAYDRPHYIHHGLGTASNDGTWRTFTRNLSADLKEFQPMNEIISIDGFFVRGTGLIDDVELLSTNEEVVNEVIYEDAEDGKNSRWIRYTSLTNPANDGTISNVYDNDKPSRVIEFNGNGVNTGYMLGAWDNGNSWKNTINKEISWDMKYSENYVVYISVETDYGHRFITYVPMSTTTCETFRNTGNFVGKSFGKHVVGDYTYITLGLCSDTRTVTEKIIERNSVRYESLKNAKWKTIVRNLETDLKKYESSNSLKSVNAFLIRGSGRVDNIKMFDSNADGDYDNSTN